MNTPYRLLIVDSDILYTDYLRRSLNQNHRLTVVGVAHDGTTALNKIQSDKPDILLIDPLLPEVNGLTLIKNIRQLQPSIKSIICLSRFYSEICIELARRNGATYYLYKPIDIDSLTSILLEYTDIAEEIRYLESIPQEIFNTNNIQRIIHEIMNELGFSSKFIGSQYIEASILSAYESPMQLHNIHSGLYQSIAIQNQTSPANVERCIRTAISAANADGKLAERIHGVPTNKTCIRYILSLLIERT